VSCETEQPIQKPKVVLKKNKQPAINMSKEALLEELEYTKIQLENFKGKYEAMKENPITVNNSVQINIVNFPSPFGTEEISHINDKIGDIIGPLIKNHPHNSIPALFQKIHNNDNLPEYHNVYSSSERSNMALVSDGKNFVFRPKKIIIDAIIEEKRSLINSYIDDNGDKLGKTILTKYDRYQDLLDENDEFHKELEIEISAMLLNMRPVIANDEKTRKLLEKVRDNV
jgi:hypothetical protein